MSPDQKKFTEKWLSLVTIALLALFALLVVYFIITELNLYQSGRQNGAEDTVVTPPLASHEVELQRYVLPVNRINFSETEIINLSDPTNLEADSSAPTISPRDKALESAQIASLEASNALPRLSTNELAVSEVFINKESELEVKSVSLSSSPTSGERFRQIARGYAAVLDLAAGNLVIAKKSGETQVVAINQNTRIMINGRTMTQQDIKIGDELRVEGVTTGPNHTLMAAVIAVIGTTEIINTR